MLSLQARRVWDPFSHQRAHHGAKITDGPHARTAITTAVIEKAIADERAAVLMRKLIESPTFPEFLTVPAYAEVLKEEKF